jgi:threonine synthase
MSEDRSVRGPDPVPARDGMGEDRGSRGPRSRPADDRMSEGVDGVRGGPALVALDGANAGYRGHLRCPRCGAARSEQAAFGGCPDCAASGAAVNLRPAYRIEAGPLPVVAREPGIFRYRRLLPLPPEARTVSLAEGGTPLLPLHTLGAELGLARLLLKDETRNPTWSYKDRLAAVAVSKAVADGARTVVVSTTGNHGAAVAAYAAAAGVECVALTLASVPATMRTLMQVYGARVFAYESGPDRWAVMAAAVAGHGWVPMSGFVDPPIGSNPYGVDGYKTLAYELWQDLGRVPDVVVMPAAYGDGLAGVHRGFSDLVALGLAEAVPRLVAVDPFGAYVAALSDPDLTPRRVPTRPSVAFSVATSIATHQGVEALRQSGGTAVAEPSDAVVMAMQARLAAAEGLYVEASAALPLVGVRRLTERGWLRPHELVVVVATSGGLKDVDATAARQPAPPTLPPDLAALDRAMAAGAGRRP